MSNSSNIFKTNNFTDYQNPQKTLYQPEQVVNATLDNYTFDNNFKEGNQEIARVLIDSGYRNKQKYPNTNHYKIELNKVYKDVISVALTMTQFPNSIYLINQTNNKFYFQETQQEVDSGTIREVVLPLGDYTEVTIKDMLETEINKVSSANISVEIDHCKSHFIISSDLGGGAHLFNMIFYGGKNDEFGPFYLEGSIGKLLGFDCINYTGCASYESPFMFDTLPHRAIVITLKDMERVDVPYGANQTEGTFVIPLYPQIKVRNDYLTVIHDDINNEDYTLHFNPPIKKLESITVTLTDTLGRPIDFNNNDHFFQLNIHSLSRFKKY